jgi:hypothetical protein
MGNAEMGCEQQEVADHGCGVVGSDPKHRVVWMVVAMGVFDHQLCLADASKSADRRGLRDAR